MGVRECVREGGEWGGGGSESVHNLLCSSARASPPPTSSSTHRYSHSLLRTPEVLHACVRAMVESSAGRAPVSVKMRSGFNDTSLFEENLLAAQEAGASFVTIHPRTKMQT